MTPREPLTLEDIWSLKSVRDVRICPDGTTVAYVVGQFDEQRNTSHLAIWLVTLHTGEARQLTGGETQDTQPRWSPDGSLLAFVSTRHEGTRQIFVIPTGGGEARRLTTTAHGAHSPIWSPDGRSICYASDLPSDRQVLPQETAWLKAHPGVSVDGRSQRRQSTLFSRVDGRGYIDRRTHLFTIGLEDGAEPQQITAGDHDHLQAAWSPDGDVIAFVANRRENAEHSFASDIWTIDHTTGDLTCLTDGSLAVAYPIWSPDGRKLAMYAAPDSTVHGYHDTHLWCVSRSGGDQRDLSAVLDRPYRFIQPDYLFPPSQPIAWHPDSNPIYFLAVDRGDCSVYRSDLETGNIDRVSRSQEAIVGVQCAADGQTLVVLAATPTHPYDMFSVPTSGGPLRSLISTNADLLASRALAPPERLAFEGADGLPIEGWLYRPARSGPEGHPLIVHVHGGPHGAFGHSFYFQAHVLAGLGYASLYVNPRGSLGYGEAFSAAADWGDKDFLDIMAGLDAVLEKGGIDPGRVGITGLSYGGFMTNWALGHTDRFAAGVSVNGMSNQISFAGVSDIGGLWSQGQMGGTFWESEGLANAYRARSPISYVDRISAPLLLLQSENDFRCPIEQGEQMLTALRVRRRIVELVRFPGTGHVITDGGTPLQQYLLFKLMIDWFDLHLTGTHAHSRDAEDDAGVVIEPLPSTEHESLTSPPPV